MVLLHANYLGHSGKGTLWQQTSYAQCPDLDNSDYEARQAPENNRFNQPEGVRGRR